MNCIAIGEKLTKLREEKGLTQEEVATALNISSAAICNYESGIRVPRDEIKKKISNFFGVSIESIFFGD